METWQWTTILGFATWLVFSSHFNVTQKLRSRIQPWATRHVITGTSTILRIQKLQNVHLDVFFSALSCVVSVPFYTAFLPLLFWSGHCKLARQMTLLMAFCDFLGNCVKDVVSAPRPHSPPVRRFTATKDEEAHAMEYGLPSSHTLNTVCLSGYLYHYLLSESDSLSLKITGLALVCIFVALIALGRIYLGMHSVIDVIFGLFLGLAILFLWLRIHHQIDSFVVSDQNVTVFWIALSFILHFAYPTPELPSPSFEYHTAFNGVALGIVAGVQQTYHRYHHEAVPRAFVQIKYPAFFLRMLIGIPTILIVKFCAKAMAKRVLPLAANAIGIPIVSSAYVASLPKNKRSSYFKKVFFFSKQDTLDVDTGIRFLQYAGLAWAVVDLVPNIYSYAMI